MTNFMNGMFGKIAPGLCRLSMSGGIAVKTSSGDYKSYNVKTGRLTNCTNFVLNIGEEFFFLVPTTKVEIGDIILVDGKPRCVVKASKNEIEVINYDNSTKETVIPNRHVFMGKTYFYGKIVSMFGSNLGGKKTSNKIMKYMMLSEMMKGNNGMTGANNNGFANMLPMMMLMGGTNNIGDMFGGILDFDDDDDDDEIEKDHKKKSVEISLPFVDDEDDEDDEKEINDAEPEK